jgi:hypothetical protein
MTLCVRSVRLRSSLLQRNFLLKRKRKKKKERRKSQLTLSPATKYRDRMRAGRARTRKALHGLSATLASACRQRSLHQSSARRGTLPKIIIMRVVATLEGGHGCRREERRRSRALYGACNLVSLRRSRGRKWAEQGTSRIGTGGLELTLPSQLALRRKLSCPPLLVGVVHVSIVHVTPILRVLLRNDASSFSCSSFSTGVACIGEGRQGGRCHCSQALLCRRQYAHNQKGYLRLKVSEWPDQTTPCAGCAGCAYFGVPCTAVHNQ